MHDTLRLKYPGHSCDPSIKYDALAARQSSPALHGSPYACIEPHGQRIAAMIRKSQMEMIEFDRGNFRVPGHRVSKSLGHRREDLSRTILSARRNSPAPQREQLREEQKLRTRET